MLLRLILLVFLVLVVFEGKLISILLNGGNAGVTITSDPPAVNVTEEPSVTVQTPETQKTPAPAVETVTVSSSGDTLAGLPSLTGSAASVDAQQQSETQAERHPTVSNPDSPAIVRQTDPPVDDSYFADAVFIGDSRMEGFRNVSGITQGRFFTSVGMSLDGLASKPLIQTEDGNITVAAAVSGGSYKKIYMMLGTNDLGEYDLEGFHDRFTSATARLMELQPGAIFYVCSIIYVEEAKVTTGEYVNNTNVDKLNAILLQICEEQGYHYLDLNEILSDGNGSLIRDASSDGVHMYEEYCKRMLDYLKSHYIPVEEVSASAELEDEASDSSEF